MAWDWASIGDWTIKFAFVIVAPVAGILGTLIGARIAGRNERRRWESEQAETRLAAARKAAIEVAESSYQWELAHFDFSRSQIGIQSEDGTVGRTLLDRLYTAKTRQSIAFATLYVSVSDQATIAGARELERLRVPLQEYLGDEAADVILGVEAARQRALARLVDGFSNFDQGIRNYIEAIAPLLAPRPES